MTHRHPFPVRLALCFTLMLVWPMAEPVHASQHAPSAPESKEQAFEKIVEARGRARAKNYLHALNQLDEAVSLAEGMEDRLPLALALHNIAEIHLHRGEPRDALNAYYRVLGVYTELGHEPGVGLVQRRIRTLSRLLRKTEKPPVSAVEPVVPVETQNRLSLVDQAVERVRQRKLSRGRDGRSAAPSGPIRVTRSEPRTTVDTPGEGVYIESLTRKIGGNSRYPEYARRTGQGGTVELVFAVQENGDVENVKLLKSSGFIVLDVEALRNVRESAPFGSVPARADPGPLTVRLTFSYKLPDAPDGAR